MRQCGDHTHCEQGSNKCQHARLTDTTIAYGPTLNAADAAGGWVVTWTNITACSASDHEVAMRQDFGGGYLPHPAHRSLTLTTF